jgi:hypothetical protein
MCKIARRASNATGIDVRVAGFDTGIGMPLAVDYRDYPEAYRQGDFPMNVQRLRNTLPAFAGLIIGDVSQTIPDFLRRLSPDYPIGFVAVDVDYYSSAKKALAILQGEPQKYLPRVVVYLDDIGDEFLVRGLASFSQSRIQPRQRMEENCPFPNVACTPDFQECALD